MSNTRSPVAGHARRHGLLLRWCSIILISSCAGITAGDAARLDSLYTALLASLPDSAASGTVAVLPFTDHAGSGSSRGIGVAEYLVGRFQQEGAFTVVDRTEFEKIVMEIELANSDLSSSPDEWEIPRIERADFLVTGTIARGLTGEKLSAKIIHTQSSTVVATASLPVPPGQLDELTRRLLGEKNQVSAPLFRSLLAPGWGQFYSQKYARGFISLGVCAGMATASIISWSRWNSADSRYREWLSATDTDPAALTGDQRSRYEAARAVSGDDAAWYNDTLPHYIDSWDDTRSDARNNAVMITALLGGAWALNVIDGAVAGVQNRREFTPYFALAGENRWMAGVSGRW